MAAPDNNNNNNNNDYDNPTAEAMLVTIRRDEEEINPNNEARGRDQEDQKPNPKPKIKLSLKSIKIRQRFIMLPIALLTFILSIPFLFEAMWLFFVQQFDCEGLLESLPRLQVGIAVGLICVFFLSNGVVYMHLRARAVVPAGLVMVKLVLVLMFIVGLTLNGRFSTETARVPASPGWLKMKVHNYEEWESVKACLHRTGICSNLELSYYPVKSYDGFVASKLSPIESGCCNPPSVCEMEYVNMTYWRKPIRSTNNDNNASYDRDCDLWQNDDTTLCYDCGTCKSGFVKTLEHKWLKLGTFLVVMSVLLMISHLMLFVITMWENHIETSY